MIPVDLITDAEWQAGVAVRDARLDDGWTPAGVSRHLAAKMALDAITGNMGRSDDIVATVEDAYRAVAVAAHPAGIDRREPDGQTCPPGGAGTWTDACAAGASRSIRGLGSTLPDRCDSHRRSEVAGHPEAPSPTGGRHDLAVIVAALVPVAIIVAQLARGFGR